MTKLKAKKKKKKSTSRLSFVKDPPEATFRGQKIQGYFFTFKHCHNQVGQDMKEWQIHMCSELSESIPWKNLLVVME